MNESALKLLLLANGSAQLLRGEEVLWNSSEDESFRDEFPDEILTEDDLSDVIDYLEEEDYVDADQAANLICMEEDGDEDEDEDDYEDDYEDEDES